MSLIKCPYCGKMVEDTTNFCPDCGSRIEKAPIEPVQYTPEPPVKKKKNRSMLFAILGLVLSWAVIGIIFSIISIVKSISGMKNPDTKKKSLISLILSIIAIVISIAVIVAAVNSDHADTSSDNTTQSTVTSTEDEVNSNELISVVTEAIQGDVGEDEKITDVNFDGKNLTVHVDLGDTESSSIPANLIAESRVGSITDSILDLDEKYFNTWESITLNFSGVGEITFDKSDIKENEYGKYFDVPLGAFDVVADQNESTSDSDADNNTAAEEVAEQNEVDESLKTIEEEVTNSEVDDATIAATTALIESTLKQNFGDDFNVSYENNVITISVWQNGVAFEVVQAQNGNEELIESWNYLKDGTESMASSIHEVVKAACGDSVYDCIYLLNDQNKDNFLLMYLNGELVYDILEAQE